MAGNSFGRILRLTTFGESHGPGLGGIVDGCPPGIPLNASDMQIELDRRKPGHGPTATSRRESDTVHILSGVFEGVTTGTPIAFVFANEDHRSSDYGNLADVFRPGHADWGFFKKFQGIRDHRGGGRSSGRETAARVAAGVIARKILEPLGTHVLAACVELGGLGLAADLWPDLEGARTRPYCAAHDSLPPLWDAAVAEARTAGETLGGVVRIEARQVPTGLGEPVFDKLDAVLAHAIMSVGAVKGFSVGEGFGAARLRGSANNDPLLPTNPPRPGQAVFASNHAGGILGGISSGQDIVLHAAVKPIASIAQSQKTVDREGHAATVQVGGRHDLSAIPRIVPVLEAMTALTLADALLLQRRFTSP
ncbi:MAG: chorismate synthase [Desulfovibrio sp.]|nr:chorismate synthase [Desulfovibrio sp.]